MSDLVLNYFSYLNFINSKKLLRKTAPITGAVYYFSTSAMVIAATTLCQSYVIHH